MSEEQAEQKIKEAGGSMTKFRRWIRGQTCPILDDGEWGYYECDVNRFISYRCDPRNEPFLTFG
jgi:hypothetical protein